MGFQPGPESRGPGRPKGSVNRRTQEVLDLIKERGDTDPLVVLSEIASKSQVPEHRISASNILAPYLHSKRGTIPAPRYAEDIQVPHFVSIQEAQNFLADIARKAGAGELELQCANDISNLVKNWILSVTAQQDYELKLAAQGGGDATIRITGGMPALPGTNIDMRNELTSTNGHVIDHVPVQAEIPIHGAPEPAKDPSFDDSSDAPSEGQK
jgi:hypothetical protein